MDYFLNPETWKQQWATFWSAAGDYFLNPETWKQQWGAFWSAFWSAPLFIGPSIVAVVIGVWWLRGRMSKRKIGGLKGEISVLKERLEAQKSAMGQRVKFAAQSLAVSSGVKDEVQKQLLTLERAIEGNADNAQLAALASKLDSAVGKWAVANNVVSVAVRRILGLTKA
jgi:hypothetical protein